MKNLRILIASIVLGTLVFGGIALAAPVSWDGNFSTQVLQPLQSFWGALVKANRFTATSTTVASIFPYASTTVTSADTLCLTGDNCRTTWPTGALEFDYGTNIFGETSAATSSALEINSTGTSTFSGGLEAWRAIAAPYFHATSTTATSTFGGPVVINQMYKPLFDVRSFGVKGDGVTNDTTALNSAFEFARTSGKCAFVGYGTYLISSPLSTSACVQFDNKATIKASVAMDALLEIGTSTASANNIKITGGVFDGNQLASRGIWMRLFANVKLQNTTVVNTTSNYYEIGDDASLPVASYEADLSHFHGYNSLSATTSNSVGLLINESATDGYYSNGILRDIQTGVRVYTGVNFFDNIHVYGRPLDVGFDDHSSRNFWNHIEADAFQSYGLIAHEFYTKISQSYFAKDSATGDSTGTGIIFYESDPKSTISGSNIRGNTSANRLQYDVVASTSANISRVGNVYEHTLTSIEGVTTNTSYGFEALDTSNNFEGGNTGIGWRAMRLTNTSGVNNTAIGNQTMYSNSSGVNNNAFGVNTLYSNTTGSYNTAMGRNALYGNTTGLYNIAIGANAGESYIDKINTNPGLNTNYNSVIDTDMIFIGNGATRDSSIASTTALSNSIAIGWNTTVDESNKVVIGSSASTTRTVLFGNLGIGTTTPAFTFQVASTTGARFALTDTSAGTNLKHWVMRSVGGNLFFATSSDALATSTIAALTLNSNGYLGIGTTSPSQSISTAGSLLVGGTATSTFAGGLAVETSGLVYDYSTNNVGIGTVAPEGPLHVLKASAGTVTAHVNAQLGVFEDNVSNGLSVLVPNASTAFYNLGSPSASRGAWFSYKSSTLTAQLGAVSVGGITELIYNGGLTGLTLDAGGNIGIGTTTPNWKLQVAGTRPFFALTDTGAGTNLKHWTLSSQGGNLYIATSSDVYATSTIPAMTINSNSNVGVGTTTPWRKFSVVGTMANIGMTGATGGANNAICISAGGDFVNETTGQCVVSSRKFKDNINTLHINALDTIEGLRTVSFTMKDDTKKQVKYGFIAEEAYDVLPQLALKGSQGEVRSLDSHSFLAILWQGMQEMLAKITGLEKRLDAQQKQIDNLQQQINSLIKK